MKKQLTGIAIAALLTFGLSLAHAEDAPTPKDAAAPAAAAPAVPAQGETPASVPRPSITPKAAEASPQPAAAEPAPRRHRRYAHRHYRHFAYWEPFPIYLPSFHRHHISWSRISWFGF
ncbi:hypothetical protein UP10_06505 [Bradyrhizobium sp. LTSPM299]|uniref:hypothetical protein n=1 Tax=Bradyrhizobium sp. LTSPM299 TaxID=1619233 RepID=UPI0005CAA8D9|nr:hypothetical protein [Bradyrhizobium sp. LTSPM299]KJC61526.1 hypothetical protein UP10_06505 [Bradyrhizobium sp. LTSPM299]